MLQFKLCDLHCHTALDVKPKTVTPHPLQHETKTGLEVCWERSHSLQRHKLTNYVRQTQLLLVAEESKAFVSIPAAHYDFSTDPTSASPYKELEDDMFPGRY